MQYYILFQVLSCVWCCEKSVTSWDIGWKEVLYFLILFISEDLAHSLIVLLHFLKTGKWLHKPKNLGKIVHFLRLKTGAWALGLLLLLHSLPGHPPKWLSTLGITKLAKDKVHELQDSAAESSSFTIYQNDYSSLLIILIHYFSHYINTIKRIL